jgi:hypothetical protein
VAVGIIVEDIDESVGASNGKSVGYNIGDVVKITSESEGIAVDAVSVTVGASDIVGGND